MKTEQSRMKAVEICKNLSFTIESLIRNPEEYSAVTMDHFKTKPKLSVLQNKKKVLMKRYKLTYKDLK